MALEHGMIEPFEDRQVRSGVVWYGVSSYGYDIRVADEFKVFTNIYTTLDRSEELRSAVVRRHQGRHLHRAAELFRAGADDRVFPDPARRPDRLSGQVDLRALRHHRQRDPVRARMGRHVTLEISNTTPLPAKIYANEGIAQVLFFQSDEPCEICYGDKKGKYLKQLDVTLPRI